MVAGRLASSACSRRRGAPGSGPPPPSACVSGSSVAAVGQRQRLLVDPAQPRLQELDLGHAVGGVALDDLVPEPSAASPVRSHAAALIGGHAWRSGPAAACGRWRSAAVPAGGRRPRRSCPRTAAPGGDRPRRRRASRRASARCRRRCAPGRRTRSARANPRAAGWTRPGPGSTSCPTSPQHAAGIRIEPPPSDPVAHGTIPEATAAAEPPEDPPGVRLGSHGLRVMPLASVAVQGKIVSSGTLVIPIGIAPAARRRRTASASAAAGGP